MCIRAVSGLAIRGEYTTRVCVLSVEPPPVVRAVSQRAYGSRDATFVNALSSILGSSLPRFSALRRMPAHAFGLSQYFAGALSSKICDKEHSTAALGDSEEARVQHSPRNVTRPEVNHRLDDDSKVSATVARECSWHVFPDGEVRLSVLGAKFANNAS